MGQKACGKFFALKYVGWERWELLETMDKKLDVGRGA